MPTMTTQQTNDPELKRTDMNFMKLGLFSILAVVVGIFMLFVCLPWSAPGAAKLPVPLPLWPRAFGILVIANVIAMWIVILVWFLVIPWMKLPYDEAENLKSNWLLGIAEGTMYPLALVGDARELIAVWLGFKAVSVWRGHSDDLTNGLPSLDARRRYNYYLFNNALRIGLGVATYAALWFWTMRDSQSSGCQAYNYLGRFF